MPRARLAGVAAYVRPNPSPLGLPGLTAPVRAAAGVGHRTSALPAARARFVAGPAHPAPGARVAPPDPALLVVPGAHTARSTCPRGTLRLSRSPPPACVQGCCPADAGPMHTASGAVPSTRPPGPRSTARTHRRSSVPAPAASHPSFLDTLAQPRVQGSHCPSVIGGSLLPTMRHQLPGQYIRLC